MIPVMEVAAEMLHCYAFRPTCIAAMPKDSDSHFTSQNPAAVMRAANSGSAGKFATDFGRYLYAV